MELNQSTLVYKEGKNIFGFEFKIFDLWLIEILTRKIKISCIIVLGSLYS